MQPRASLTLLTMLQLLLRKLTALVMCSMPVARYSSLHNTSSRDQDSHADNHTQFNTHK